MFTILKFKIDKQIQPNSLISSCALREKKISSKVKFLPRVFYQYIRPNSCF